MHRFVACVLKCVGCVLCLVLRRMYFASYIFSPYLNIVVIMQEDTTHNIFKMGLAKCWKVRMLVTVEVFNCIHAVPLLA